MEEKKIGADVSSGAQKVEEIERATRSEEKQRAGKSSSAAKKRAASSETANGKKKAAKPAAKSASKRAAAKKPTKPTVSEKKSASRAQKREERETAAAEERLEAAKAKAQKKERKLMKRAELKQKKMEKKAALKEKRLAHKTELAEKKAARKANAEEKKLQLKARRAERKAEKIARRELLKNESKTERRRRLEREKREKLALKRQKQEAAEKAREQKMKAREAARDRRAAKSRHKSEQKTERKKHAPGFGGWLAAVISLGVVCLALTTIVTAGAFRMNDMTVASGNSMRATLYEMVSASQNLDDNLEKLQVSSGREEQRRLLTEVLVDSALLENALERCPVDAATSTDISSFVNRTNAYARRLLAKIADGQTLSQTERNTLSYLYGISSELHAELNDLATHVTEKDLMAFADGKTGAVGDRFGEMGNSVRGEPKETVDAPFSGEGNVGENALSAEEEISQGRAEELVKEYLSAYRVRDVRYTGETVGRDVQCYNFVLTDENGIEIFAQIAKRGGKLAFFDTYEACDQKNFDLQTCDSLAREFLAGLGIANVDAVWLSDAGTVADLTYVAVTDGVRSYPEMIRVRVCETRGRVVGMDASAYLVNRAERSFAPTLSEEEARAMLTGGLEVKASHLALVPVDGAETLAYEFECSVGEKTYVVYIDAESGEEVQVYVVRETARGRFLR